MRGGLGDLAKACFGVLAESVYARAEVGSSQIQVAGVAEPHQSKKRRWGSSFCATRLCVITLMVEGAEGIGMPSVEQENGALEDGRYAGLFCDPFSDAAGTSSEHEVEVATLSAADPEVTEGSRDPISRKYFGEGDQVIRVKESSVAYFPETLEYLNGGLELAPVNSALMDL